MNLIKIFTITLAVIAFQSLIFAQETPFGKKLAEDFWKALEEKKYVAAENKLGSLKRREPNFDASKMEKALADAKTQRDTARADAATALRSRVKNGTNLKDLFVTRNVQADSFDTLDKIKTEIANYAKKTEEVLAEDRSAIAGDLEDALESIKRDLSSDAEKNAKLIKSTNEALQPKHAEASYYELLLRQAYWDDARKIFPDESEIAKAYNSISASINALGTPDQRAAKADKNMNAKIDAERVPKAVVNDAKLEKWFRDVFTETSARRNNNVTVLKVVIVTSDYAIKRHEITGIVVGRSRGADIAFKDKDGKCKHGLYSIYQEYVGGSFTGASLSLEFNDKEMRCENIK